MFRREYVSAVACIRLAGCCSLSGDGGTEGSGGGGSGQATDERARPVVNHYQALSQGDRLQRRVHRPPHPAHRKRLF